jgi:hypothetical protein
MFARFGRNGRRLVWGGALSVLLLAAGNTLIGDVSPEAKRARAENGFSLFAGPTAVLTGNQLACGLSSQGQVCTNVFDSPTGGGGFWPVGTTNGYIFNTGLQIAGIVGEDGGPWANDTTATFFFDARGTNQHGTAITNIFDSLNPDDLEDWPDEARIPVDPIFQPVLWGRRAASQQDSWVQYWDGDPARNSGRLHPLGIRVTQRSMAWNYPAGNESVVYFLYTFENVTSEAEFQRLNNNQFFGGDPALPASGYTINEAYAAFAADNDVSNAFDENFSTAMLSFDMGISYHGGFAATEFSYVPEIFFPPFFTSSPGLVGVKYLKSPIRPGSDPPEEVGLTLFSITLNASFGFPDPSNGRQLWRYLSGKVSPSLGDNPCNVQPEVVTADPTLTQRSVCFIFQESEDTRFYQSSGPFSIGPQDEPATIVVAYVLAATVATMPDGSPSGIIPNTSPNDNAPGVPSFHPGFTSARGCTPEAVLAEDLGGCSDVLSAAANPVKPIERGAGWFQYTGADPSGRLNGSLEAPDNKLDQFNVVTVPNSLLGRALVAQSIFDNAFLLGFSPEQPTFYLVPGDEEVTVVWEESPTELNGDPFYEVASNPASTLYNPNYRQFDVEGYRVWRGTDATVPDLLAQFDKANSVFEDYTCETVPPDEDAGVTRDGIPVVGFVAGETCPGSFPDVQVAARNIATGDLIFNNGGGGGLPGAGASRSIDLTALGVNITNIIVDDDAGTGVPALDTGVPFVFTDSSPANNFTYWYAVSAFDVNSEASGPHTLRSSKVAQATVPRKDSPEMVGAELQASIAGDDGVPLDFNAFMPSLDPDHGTFSGPIPATNGVEQGFAPLVPRLLPQFELTATVDSIKPDWVAQEGCGGTWDFTQTCFRAFLTVDGNPVEAVGPAFTWGGGFSTAGFTEVLAVSQEIPFDPEALRAFGIPSGSGFATAVLTLDESINFINWEGEQNRRGRLSRTIHGGPRWFNGTENTIPDPTKYIRVGRLAEVDSVWIPIHHTQMSPTGTTGTSCVECIASSGTVQYFGYYQGYLGRAADLRVTWADGTISVRDVTHNVDVSFSADYGSSWGFLNDDVTGDGSVSWEDFFCVGPGRVEYEAEELVTCNSTAALSATPTIHSILLGPNDDGGSTTGNGFTLFLNGMRHFFLTEALPADGTEWTLRTYNGSIRSAASSYTTDDPDGYTYTPVYDTRSAAGLRNPFIPGLTIGWLVESNTVASGPLDLTEIHTVPDPYLTSSQLDRGPTSKELAFVNLPTQATIRIYTLTGVLVDLINHNDVSGGGRAVWDMRNRNNQFVASGVYFYHVATPQGEEFVSKFTIVNFAGQN